MLYGESTGPLDDITLSCTITPSSLSCTQPEPTSVGSRTVRLVHLRDQIGNERDVLTDPEEWEFVWDDEAPVVTTTSPTICTDGASAVTISAAWDDGAGCGVVVDSISPIIAIDSVPIPHSDPNLTLTVDGFSYVKTFTGDDDPHVSILSLGDVAGNGSAPIDWTFPVDHDGPGVVSEVPVADSVVTSVSTVRGSWAEGCAGVNLSTVIVTVDGQPCIMEPSEPTAIGFECTPTLGPDPVHQVVVASTDTMGHSGGRTWSFVLGGCLHLDHAESPFGTAVSAVKLGSVVSLIGNCIANGATVDFNGQQQLATTFIGPTRLEFVVPPGARGGPVRIVNPDGEASNSIELIVVIADGLSNISGLVLGTDDGIYVANQGTNRVLRINPETGAVIDMGGHSLAKGLTRDPADAMYYGSNQDPTTQQATANRIKWFNWSAVPPQPDAEWTTSTSFFTRTRAGGLAIDPVTFGTFAKVFEASTANTGASDGGVVYRTQGTNTQAFVYSTPLWPGQQNAHVGMAFDRAGVSGATSAAGVGNLYVTSSSNVLKIPPHAGPPVSNVTVTTGITGAAGLDWHEGLERLLVTAQAGRLWLVDPTLAGPANKVQVYQGLSQPRYGRFDTIHRAWDGPVGALAPNPTQVIVAEANRVLSVRYGVSIAIDSVAGIPPTGPPLTDEFSPDLDEVLVVGLSGASALAGDNVRLEMIRLHDDPLGGHANASHVVRDMGTFSIGPAGDIVPDASGNWTHDATWDGQCGGNCYVCPPSGCPVVTRSTPAGRQVVVHMRDIGTSLHPGQYVLRARLERNGFVLGEAQHEVFVPHIVQLLARWNDGGATYGNLHTNLRWMGLATSPGMIPIASEEVAVRQTVLERMTDFVRTTVGLDTARIRWLQGADDPAAPPWPGLTVWVGGDKVFSAAYPDEVCGLAWTSPPADSCVNDYGYLPVPPVEIWTGHIVDATGVPLGPFPQCRACSGVPHVFGQVVTDCEPFPDTWIDEQEDLYYEISRRFVPDYGGVPLAPGEWPITGAPTDRQVALDAYLTAFARHTGLFVAHELGHLLGVPQFRRYPDCDANGHNVNLEPSAAPGPGTKRDTAHDLMDGSARWLYTPETGLKAYTFPNAPDFDDTKRARFQNEQCDAEDQDCLWSAVHPFSYDDIQVGNR